MSLTREGRLLFAGRALRTFCFGWLSLTLALLLAARGLSPAAIGAVFTATLVEDALLRQAYAMALVAPDERAAAAGFTASARSLAQAMAPVLTGFAMARAATGLPFFVAGGLKIVYDLALYFRFRRLPLPADETAAR